MGSLILGDGTKHTIEQQKPEVKVQGDDVYIDGVPVSLPQHKRVVVVLGNAMGSLRRLQRLSSSSATLARSVSHQETSLSMVTSMETPRSMSDQSPFKRMMGKEAPQAASRTALLGGFCFLISYKYGRIKAI